MREKWMQYALQLAEQAFQLGEVPVGAVIVKNDQIIGEGFNKREAKQSPLEHAEIEAIAMASKNLATWRLTDCALYVTLEPCLMCAGALHQARMGELYFGAFDPKAGACGTLYNIPQDGRLNHRFPVVGGILEEECSEILKRFFRQKREQKS